MPKTLRETAVANGSGNASFTSPTDKQVVISRVESPAGNVATQVTIEGVAYAITTTGPDVAVSIPVGKLGAAVVVDCPNGASGGTCAVTWRWNK